MLLGAVLLVVAGTALVAGSGLLGSGFAAAAGARRLPAETVRSAVVGLAGALAATVVAVGQGRTALASGVPFGAAMFLLASAFGASALLARRPLEVREPVTFAAPGAAVVLMSLSIATDRALTRIGGVLLTVVFVPYLAWILMEPDREAADAQAPGTADGDRPDWGWSERPVAPPATIAAPATVAAPPVDMPRVVGSALAGLALVVGGAFAVVEGATRIAERAPLVPGFAGAALAGSLVALPFTLLVLFPRRGRPEGADPPGATLIAVTGLLTVVPGLAAIVRPFELDGAATIAVLSAALLYAIPASWMLLRGRGGRVMGAVVLVAYAACLLYAGSL